MPDKPLIKNKKIVARSGIFAVEQLDLRFSNGEERTYERLLNLNWPAVMMVPMLDEETVLLVREYAAGFEDYHLSLAKGAVDPGEELLDAANRELMEEVGYGARKLTEITELTLAPAYMSHRIHVILAQDLYEKRLPGDEPEPIEVVPFPIRNLEQLVADPTFSEARALAALYIIRDRLLGKNG